jgi:MarR-like DNA-binding transcriptional regulator SgrR of sgrS sRNA
MESALRTVDPAAAPIDASDAAARAHLLPLVFETLVTVDRDACLTPLLAVSWEHDARAARWRFRLRPGAKSHDGRVIDAAQVAAALRSQEAGWRTAADGDAVVIEADREMPDLLWQLADLRYAVALRRPTGELAGTGPFRIERLDSKSLLLRAHEEHWNGRPFVDTVQVDMARAPSDQMASFEAGRADLIAVRPVDAARTPSRGRLLSSRPREFVGVIFEDTHVGASSDSLRRALTLAIDRGSLSTVLLQRHAEPAASVLPDWLSGYAAMFQSHHDVATARALVGALPPASRTLALRVDSSNAVDRAVADRIAVDAREAGLSIRVDPADALAPRPDMRLVRLRLEASSPERALASALAGLGSRLSRLLAAEPVPGPGTPIEDVYKYERHLIERRVIVPIAHLPELYAVSGRVDSASGPIVFPSGTWDLANVYVRDGNP